MTANLVECKQWAFTLASLIALVGCSGFPTEMKSDPSRVASRGRVRAFPRQQDLCVIFRETLWQEFDFGEDSSAEVARKATLLWEDLKESEIESYGLSGTSWEVAWQDQYAGRGISYFAKGRRKVELDRIHVVVDPGITLAQVLDCLGPPQYYGAEIPVNFQNGLLLVLLYVERGIYLSGLVYGGREQPTEFQPTFRMGNFDVVPSGDLMRMASHLSPPGLHKQFLCELRPWPGSIAKVVIDFPLDERPRCGH